MVSETSGHDPPISITRWVIALWQSARHPLLAVKLPSRSASEGSGPETSAWSLSSKAPKEQSGTVQTRPGFRIYMAESWAAMMPYLNLHLCSWIFLIRLAVCDTRVIGTLLLNLVNMTRLHVKGPGSYESLKQFIHQILGRGSKRIWTFKNGLKMVDFSASYLLSCHIHGSISLVLICCGITFSQKERKA